MLFKNMALQRAGSSGRAPGVEWERGLGTAEQLALKPDKTSLGWVQDFVVDEYVPKKFFMQCLQEEED